MLLNTSTVNKNLYMMAPLVGKKMIVTHSGNPKGIFGGKTIVPIVSDSKTAKSENPKGIFGGGGWVRTL
jgi:hypothetical protein